MHQFFVSFSKISHSTTISEADNFDETYGINVQFEESDDDEEEDQFGEVKEDMDLDEQDDEQGEEATVTTMLSANVRTNQYYSNNNNSIYRCNDREIEKIHNL